jgi:hypothetical protein
MRELVCFLQQLEACAERNLGNDARAGRLGSINHRLLDDLERRP